MNLRQKLWMDGRGPGFGVMLLLVLGAVSFSLVGVFLPGNTLFSNDGPLARLVMECHRLPERFYGCWDDLYAMGYSEGAATPTLSSGLMWLLGPVAFSKFYALVALMVLGMAAWCFFRQAGLAPAACLLGGLAACLNSGFFTAACWGVAAHPLVVAMAFFAMASLWDTRSGKRWVRLVLGGLAVGMAVAEGADIGALFSMVVAGFLAFQTLIEKGPMLKKVPLGALRIAMVAVFAAFLGAECVSQVFVTNVEGAVSGSPEEQTAQGRWEWSTQWSLPKVETLSLFVPGLFGYRMDYPDGGAYWGAIGRTAEWDRYLAGDKQGPQPGSLIRFTGGSCYAGIPVVLIALWAVLQSLRRGESLFDLSRRRWIWFWTALGLMALLLAYGRFAPFYRLIYHLPFFSSMRNPTKFLHIVAMAIVVLFAYGVDGLWRGYLSGPAGNGGRQGSKARSYDRWWIFGLAVALVLSIGGWWYYSNSESALESYLQTVGFRDFQAELVARFSIGQVGWFILFYLLSAGLLTLILMRLFAGKRGRWAMLWLGMILVLDLWRANRPWITYWNYPSKYVSNPILDILRDKPYEHRVTLLPATPPPRLRALARVYKIEWLQQTMPYYNIQSVDISQLARRPQDMETYDEIFRSGQEAEGARRFGRRMQLTNTRYAFGYSRDLDMLNAQLDPGHGRVRVAARFNVVPKLGLYQAVRAEDLTAVPDPNGGYALFEYTGALPRASLYQHWQVETNDQEVLRQLISPDFHPTESVFVSSPIPSGASTGGTNATASHTEITGYTSRRVDIKAEAAGPSVLLLNDRFAPGWQVWVDGRRETLLRCNYIMRGVYLGPGSHTVSFQYHPQVNYLYVSASAVGLAVILLGYLGLGWIREPNPAASEVPLSRPVTAPPKAEPRMKAVAGNGRGRRGRK